MGGKLRRIETGLLNARFQDEFDRLWRHCPAIEIAPLVDASVTAFFSSGEADCWTNGQSKCAF